jgi:hypothetical protein
MGELQTMDRVQVGHKKGLGNWMVVGSFTITKRKGLIMLHCSSWS